MGHRGLVKEGIPDETGQVQTGSREDESRGNEEHTGVGREEEGAGSGWGRPRRAPGLSLEQRKALEACSRVCEVIDPASLEQMRPHEGVSVNMPRTGDMKDSWGRGGHGQGPLRPGASL